MSVAYSLIRDEPHYRRAAFDAGLRAAGLEVRRGVPPASYHPQKGDALLIWNRYGTNHDIATAWDKAGGTVLVAENAYMSVDRINPMRYALARDGHNGIGAWHVGAQDRWAKLGLEIAPWREDGAHILVCPNRCFGKPGYIMPVTWIEQTVEKLKRITKRPVRVRPHPGNGQHKKPLAEDLRDAWAVVIWYSSTGCEALLRGIPVFSEAPAWVMRPAASKGGLVTIDNPELPGNRADAFQRLAWAQWTVEEIESGEPFQHLLYRPSAFGGGL